jgi:putative transposase
MIGLEDRQALAQDIQTAHGAGARLQPACEIAGIDLRTLQRWKAQDGLTAGDGRPQAVRPAPSHALSPQEQAALLAVANEPRFASVPPARIVPMLADEGIYLGSESSMARVLKAHGQNTRRGRAKAPKATRPPTTHIATAPGQVWCWDMTYLPANVMGRWFHLYLILDLYSRKIVGAEVHASDDATTPCTWCAAPRWPRASPACTPSRCCMATTARHSKPRRCWRCCTGWACNPRTRGPVSATTTPTPSRCSARPSTAPSSPPRASPAWMRPGPGRPDSCVGTTSSTGTAASATSPRQQRHAGQDTAILAARHALYVQARERNPARWSRDTRNWSPVGAVTLNPERDAVVSAAADGPHTQQMAA